MSPFVRRLRRYFLVGIVVLAPVGLTVFVLRWLFESLDSILGTPLRDYLGFRIPGLGFVLLIAVVLVVGWIVHRAVGRRLLHWWNEALVRFPLTGRIYNAVSQIVQSMIGERRKLFRRTVLIPYPTDGVWAIAFVTNETAELMSQIVREPCVTVFVPSTPNPTTGFMLVVPRTRVLDTDISVEDAMKLILSGGAVSPSDTAALTPRRGLDVDSLLKDS
jgi:uncharacterized membrane protein